MRFSRWHHRQHQIAFTARLGADQRSEAQALQGQNDGMHMAMRARCGDLEVLCDRLQCLAAAERMASIGAADRLDRLASVRLPTLAPSR